MRNCPLCNGAIKEPFVDPLRKTLYWQGVASEPLSNQEMKIVIALMQNPKGLSNSAIVELCAIGQRSVLPYVSRIRTKVYHMALNIPFNDTGVYKLELR